MNRRWQPGIITTVSKLSVCLSEGWSCSTHPLFVAGMGFLPMPPSENAVVFPKLFRKLDKSLIYIRLFLFLIVIIDKMHIFSNLNLGLVLQLLHF